MLVVLDANGYVMCVLHKPTAADYLRPDVVPAPENVLDLKLTDRHRFLDGGFVDERVPVEAPPLGPGQHRIGGRQR